ncbi:hypothetical protein LZ32DRAFT_242418 [Colletotrichum eremochloae]|nr:hypothetical protein LZ32DRAFT_242418 [Colletotrichum eremochloae]
MGFPVFVSKEEGRKRVECRSGSSARLSPAHNLPTPVSQNVDCVCVFAKSSRVGSIFAVAAVSKRPITDILTFGLAHPCSVVVDSSTDNTRPSARVSRPQYPCGGSRYCSSRWIEFSAARRRLCSAANRLDFAPPCALGAPCALYLRIHDPIPGHTYHVSKTAAKVFCILCKSPGLPF